MSRYKVEELCFSLASEANLARFKSDPEGYAAAYDLSEAEKEAVVKGDVGGLYRMDVNTQALVFLSRAFGCDNAAYVARLREALGLPEVPEQMAILRRRTLGRS